MEHYLSRQIDYTQPAFTEAFDELPFWSASFALLLFRELPLIRSGAVLDIGCGTGFPLTLLAARLGPEVQVVGIDPWAAAIDRAQRRITAMGLPNAQAILGDATQAPFPDTTFDLVVSNLTVNNVDDIPALFQECHRVLKPGGRLCLTTNLNGTFKEVYALMLEALAQLGEETALMALGQQAAARLVPTQLADHFLNSGFEELRMQEADHFPRWASGTAFLNDPLIVMGFLPAWKKVIPAHWHKTVFTHVERALNNAADLRGEVLLTIPLIYMQGRKAISGPPL